MGLTPHGVCSFLGYSYYMNNKKLFFKVATAGFLFGALLLVTQTGCVGFVGGGYGGGVVVAEPDLVLFGGGYDRGRDVHGYSQRGSESRAVAHSGGGGGRR
jgi:hypothetical protein